MRQDVPQDNLNKMLDHLQTTNPEWFFLVVKILKDNINMQKILDKHNLINKETGEEK